ncbi:MAG: hypothetical protein H6819_08590 [Phycisphaerales bacterium]|nr:hypothetical protein [Phycisphaerales bacterium]MCB9855712.1 hypothetical protein [Phycisphaerales bacterium]MCB9862607.1 hypothetical protein [Phycisphaerales bacterium]
MRIASIEAEIGQAEADASWAPQGYYTAYYVVAGMVLGTVAAAASLLFNVIGAVMLGEPALKLISVYLTFPLGEKALHMDAAQSGFILAGGCGLYLLTGMFGGIPFHLILSRYFANDGFVKRFVVASIMGIGVWLINFYGIIRWAQPLLIGGNWIIEEIPKYVAVATHLVFAWTMLLLSHWGRFVPPTAGAKGRPA